MYNAERFRSAATEERLEALARRAARDWQSAGIAVDSGSIRISQRRGPELWFEVQVPAAALESGSFGDELLQFAEAAAWTLPLPLPTIWLLQEKAGVVVRVCYSTHPLDS